MEMEMVLETIYKLQFFNFMPTDPIFNDSFHYLRAAHPEMFQAFMESNINVIDQARALNSKIDILFHTIKTNPELVQYVSSNMQYIDLPGPLQNKDLYLIYVNGEVVVCEIKNLVFSDIGLTETKLLKLFKKYELSNYKNMKLIFDISTQGVKKSKFFLNQFQTLKKNSPDIARFIKNGQFRVVTQNHLRGDLNVIHHVMGFFKKRYK